MGTQMQRLLAMMMLVLLSSGCAIVTSGLPTTGSVNGDTWYTKDKYYLFRLLTVESDVYWCPKDAPTKCVKAELKEN
jgi:hypothetical protein